jgi:energy-coupling factor transporter ATP-binding protein EcfA2
MALPANARRVGDMVHIHANSGHPIIRTARLTKRDGSTVALDHLSSTIEAGEVHGFLGPNGAGKTTTIRLLLGLHRHDSRTPRAWRLRLREAIALRSELGAAGWCLMIAAANCFGVSSPCIRLGPRGRDDSHRPRRRAARRPAARAAQPHHRDLNHEPRD